MQDFTPLQHNALQILIRETDPKQTISGLNLAKRLGLKKGNGKVVGGELRAIIHALRVKNFPICANSRGYFYAKRDDDLSKFIMKLEGRVVSQQTALKGLQSSFHNVGAVHQTAGTALVRKTIRKANGLAGYHDFKVGADGTIENPDNLEIL